MIAEQATGRLLLIERRQSEHRALVTSGEAGASTATVNKRRLPRAGVSRSPSGRWASLLHLSSHSPDLSPIQQLLAKLKAFLRRAAARSKDPLWALRGSLLDAFTLDECQLLPNQRTNARR